MKPTLILSALALMLAPFVMADPCGMVPPIYRGPGPVPVLERQGLQKTYVFYKDGIETFAVRPGFRGDVKDFGMLIPVPSVPSLRKIADDTFAHIAAAIDPPEIDVYVYDREMLGMGGGGRGWARKSGAPTADAAVEEEHTIRLVKEEAVGMYQVAVLEAGSANALKKWMEENDYTYPDGMDTVCNEYVSAGWLFVAIKAKVGAKSGVDPQPGMGDVNPDRPAGSAFDGNVQGMAFRFRTPQLVVPMRLSSYNPGETRNVVYCLTDTGSNIDGVPEEFVKRQVSGEQLYLNLTQPLPLRIHGGKYSDINPAKLKAIEGQRNPKAHNGLARELFSGDLLALRSGLLELEFETREKELLKISERLDLRGKEMDLLHREALSDSTGSDYDAALIDLLSMTLTVIDGDFQRDLLRRDNLHFMSYEMPASRNSFKAYNAIQASPGWNRGGQRWVDESRNSAVLDIARDMVGMSIPQRKTEIKIAKDKGAPIHNPLASVNDGGIQWYWLALIGIAALGAGVLIGLRKNRGTTAALMLLGVFLATGTSHASEAAAPAPPNNDRLASLDDPKLAEVELEKLIAGKEVRLLQQEALFGRSTLSRGWAVVGLAEIGSQQSKDTLNMVQTDGNQKSLVRCWAVGGLLVATTDPKELATLAGLSSSYPAIAKPLAKKLLAGGDKASVRDLISLSLTVPSIQSAMVDEILKTPPEALVEVMMSDKDMRVAQTAASYLASIGQQQNEAVADAVIKGLECPDGSTEVCWKSGALWVPNITWNKEKGTELVTNLIDWGLWCVANGKTNLLGNVVNNLNSINLNRAVGYQRGGGHNMVQWVKNTGNAIGKEKMEAMLLKHNLIDNQSYAAALANIK
ncbi:MAG: DUF2330 domain-containing protein [Planctomycetota bacterium]|jgi:hypothetical protein